MRRHLAARMAPQEHPTARRRGVAVAGEVERRRPHRTGDDRTIEATHDALVEARAAATPPRWPVKPRRPGRGRRNDGSVASGSTRRDRTCGVDLHRPPAHRCTPSAGLRLRCGAGRSARVRSVPPGALEATCDRPVRPTRREWLAPRHRPRRGSHAVRGHPLRRTGHCCPAGPGCRLCQHRRLCHAVWPVRVGSDPLDQPDPGGAIVGRARRGYRLSRSGSQVQRARRRSTQ